MNDKDILKHPSYGMISANRTNCYPARNFFGAETRHEHYITLEINTGDVTRGLNKDWYHSGDRVISVALTPIQWAVLLTNMNTTGVPCTLEHIKGEGRIESPPELQDKIDLHKVEFEEYTQDILTTVSKNLKDLESCIDNNKGKRAMRESLNNLAVATKNLKPNLEFAATQFDKHVDRVVLEATQKIDANIEHKIITLGQNALNAKILESNTDNLLIGDK